MTPTPEKTMPGTATFATVNMATKRAKQQVILDAAERVFSSKPFSQVSMRDIARAAGISHATIYRYFPDKQALFVEAFVRGVRSILQSIGDCSKLDPRETVVAVATLFVDFLFENDHYFKMMSHFMLHGELSRDRVDRLNSMIRPLLDHFEDLFCNLGVQRDTRLLAHCFFCALNGILITFRDYPGRSRREVHRHIRRLSEMTARLFSQSAADPNLSP